MISRARGSIAHLADDQADDLALCGRPGPWRAPAGDERRCDDCATVELYRGRAGTVAAAERPPAPRITVAKTRTAWFAHLAAQPGRCPGCAAHVVTQGHCEDCPLGPRSKFPLDPADPASTRAMRLLAQLGGRHGL